MVQINMLPWREKAREIKKKQFFTTLGIAVGITLFIIFLFHLYYKDLIAYQDHRNQFLQLQISQRQAEIDELRKKKEQQNGIEVKLHFLMNMREKSYHAVTLLNELLRTVPDTITLTKIVRENNAITLEGRAQSELAITAFLKSLSQSPIFNQPVLTAINTMPNTNNSNEKFFQLKMDQK